MNVTYCKNSTLREAYAAVIGLPAPLNPAEHTTLRTRFAREWPDHEVSSYLLQQTPSPAVPSDPQAPIPPAWHSQITWGQRQWVGRWGHRTSGLHRVVLDGEQYLTFDRTMRPTLSRWLAATHEAYDFVGVNPPVASVVSGYVNALHLHPGDGDLSEWFRFNFAIEAAGADAGLSELSLGARIPRPESRARASIRLSAQQDEADIRVTVHTFVEREVPEGLQFSQTDALLDELHHARVIAKETFFSFVTDRTLNHLGAMDAAQPEA